VRCCRVANIDNWQPDFSNFSSSGISPYPSDYGNAVSGTPGSWFANVRLPNVRSIMYQVGVRRQPQPPYPVTPSPGHAKQ
jgi:hypothetical protein